MPGTERTDRSGSGSRKKSLTPEEEVWFEIASRIGCSPDEAEEKTTATQFIKWVELLHREDNKFHRSDYPIARVAYEVYQLRATLAAIFKLELPQKDIIDFIPKFTYEKPQDLMDPEEVKKLQRDRMKENQAMRLAMVGLDEQGNMVRDFTMPSLKVAAELQKAALEQLQAEEEKSKAAQAQTQETTPNGVMQRASLRQVKGRKGKK